MILFASDFGVVGPYVGQVRAVLADRVPDCPVVDLMHDLPAFRPLAAGCLLRAILRSLDGAGLSGAGRVVLAVVDPGVGTARDPIIVEAGDTRYVGPDNGLLAPFLAQGGARARRIDWRPERLSDSFHGRDLFAPVAAMLARGRPVASTRLAIGDLYRPDAPDPLAEVIYCDGYGNAMTGLDAEALSEASVLEAAGHRFRRARTFGEVPVGGGFWYANSLGLAEIAVNQGDAAATFGLAVGTPIGMVG